MSIECSTPVAVLMATYNGEKYLREQIDSILSQSFGDLTLYIHDDGSRDGTVGIIREYAAKYPGRIVVLEHESTGGASNNFFYMLGEVEADYIMFCDQDDVWLPEKVSRSLSAMHSGEKNNPGKPVCVHCDLEVVNKDLRTIHRSFYGRNRKDPGNNSFRQLLCINICVGCTMIINRKLRTSALHYHNKKNIYMHDWWIALIAAQTGKILFIPEPLIKYRQHENNVVGAKLENKSIFSKISQLSDYIGYKKDHLAKQRRMAAELAQLPEISDSRTRKFLSELAVIQKRNKLSRVLFYRRNGILADGNIFLQLLGV